MLDPSDVKKDYSLNKFGLNFKDSQFEQQYLMSIKNDLKNKQKFAIFLAALIYFIVASILFSYEPSSFSTMLIAYVCLSFGIFSFVMILILFSSAYEIFSNKLRNFVIFVNIFFKNLF